jgi:hypothetical protein
MYGGVDVRCKDWPKEMAGSLKMGVPALPIHPDLAFILKSLEQVPINTRRRILAFLTGSASHSEFDVTHSKQTSAQFLTGARTGIKRSVCCTRFRCFSLPKLQSASRNPPHPSSNFSAHFCTNFFLGLMLDSEIVFL